MMHTTKDGHPRFAHFAIFVVLLMAVSFVLTHDANQRLSKSNAVADPDGVGLISYWPLDTENLSVTPDTFGRVDGIVAGGSSVGGVGQVGGAADFYSATGLISLGENFNSLNYPFTVMAWVNIKGRPLSGLGDYNSPIFTTDDDVSWRTGFQLKIQTDDSSPTFQLQADLGNGLGNTSANLISKRSGPSINLNEWTHVAAVVGGPDDMSLFIDCANVGSFYYGTAATSTLTTLPHAYAGALSPHFARSGLARIGKNAAPAFYGLIDEVRVYNRKLTQAQICPQQFNASILPGTNSVSIVASPTFITFSPWSSNISWTVKYPHAFACTPTSSPTNSSWNSISVPMSPGYPTFTDLDAMQWCNGQSAVGGCTLADINNSGGTINSTDESLFTAYVTKYDINGDGIADYTNDLARLRSCMGLPPTGTCAASDLNASGFIDSADMSLFKDNFGKYNFNVSSNFTVDKAVTTPQTGSVNIGPLATSTAPHTFRLSCSGVFMTPVLGSATVTYIPPKQCEDTYDNDGDGEIDYPPLMPIGEGDIGCSSASDNDESNIITPLSVPKVAITSDKTLLCPGWQTNIYQFAPPRNINATYGSDSGTTISISSLLVSPVGLVYESQNKFIWLLTRGSGTGASKLKKINPTTAQVEGSWAGPFPTGASPSTLISPSALGTSPGYLYLADKISSPATYRIKKIDASNPTAVVTGFVYNFILSSSSNIITSFVYNPIVNKVYFGVTGSASESGLYQFDAGGAGITHPVSNVNIIKMLFHPATPNSIWILNSNGDLSEFKDGVGIVKTVYAVNLLFVAQDMFGDQNPVSNCPNSGCAASDGKIWITRNVNYSVPNGKIMGLSNLTALTGSEVISTLFSVGMEGSDNILAGATNPLNPNQIWKVTTRGISVTDLGNKEDTPGTYLLLPEASNLVTLAQLPAGDRPYIFAVTSPRNANDHPSLWVAYQSLSNQIVRKIPMYLGGPINTASNSCSMVSDTDPGWIPAKEVAPYAVNNTDVNGKYITPPGPIGGFSGDSKYTISCTGTAGTTVASTTITSLSSCPGSEFPQCSDGEDNDGDGKIDYSSIFGVGDLACSSPSDNSEKKPVCGLYGCERSLGEQGFNVSSPFYCYTDCRATKFTDF